MSEQLALARGFHRMHDLGDHLDRDVAPRDLDRHRVAHEGARELPDFIGKRRREEQVLALRRQKRENAAHVGQEAHGEQAVGLIEDEDLDLREIDRLLMHVIEQPARRRDDDVHAATQLRGLRIESDAAENDRGPELQKPAVVAHALVDLRGELARRHDHESADRTRRGRGARIGLSGEQLQHRQDEARGLSGARLRGSEQIAAGERERNGPHLDGGRNGVATLAHGAEQLRRKTEILEGRADRGLLKSAWEGSRLPTRFRRMRFLNSGNSSGTAKRLAR